MKQFLLILLLFLIYRPGLCQQKLKNGIYLIDQSSTTNKISSTTRKASVSFNPLFVEDDPELYAPIVILTNDFVPLDLSSVSLVESKSFPKKMLQLQLTDSATSKLTSFTSTIPKRYVVIVVNGDALSIHEIQEPVTSGTITLSRCRNNGLEQVYRVLKRN